MRQLTAKEPTCKDDGIQHDPRIQVPRVISARFSLNEPVTGIQKLKWYVTMVNKA